jgi:hypothetical protein
MRVHLCTAAIVTTLGSALASSAANAAPEYSVANLAAFGGTRNQANSVNNDGVVAGLHYAPRRPAPSCHNVDFRPAPMT